MQSELRKVIRGILAEIFNEADIKKHVWDRYNDRILRSTIDVGYEDGPPTPKAENIVIVGTSSLTDAQKEEIRQRILDVEKVNFKRGKTYGVKIYDLFIDPKNVTFNSELDKQKSRGKTLIYVVSDANGHSVGNEVWLATDEFNNVPTLMFRRRYLPPVGRYNVIIKDFNRILTKQV